MLAAAMPCLNRPTAINYLTALRARHAAQPFAASVVARLPISMAPLGILLLIQHESGHYGFAGLVTAAFAVGTAAGGPGWGALVDRLGQPRIVAPTAAFSAMVLVAFTASAVHRAPGWALICLAGLSGMTFPPVGPAMRATWKAVLPGFALQRIGLALDAIAVEIIYIGGPLLLSFLLLVSPVAPLLVTAVLLAFGGLGYCLTKPVRSQKAGGHVWRAASSGDRLGWLEVIFTPGMLTVLAVTTAMSVAFGHMETSLAATAGRVLNDQSRLGLLYSAIGVGSVTGGLVYGVRRVRGLEHHRLPKTLAVFLVGLAPLSLLMSVNHPRLWLILPFLLVAGLAISPSIIIQQNLVDALSPPGRASEAQAWLWTASTCGTATGTAIAGIVIDRFGLAWSFGDAIVAVAVAAMIAKYGQGLWDSRLARRLPAADKPYDP